MARKLLRFVRLARFVCPLAVVPLGCASLIGFPDYGSSSAGGGGAGVSSSASTASGGPTEGGTDGSGGGEPACQEGAPCYFGLDGTEGIGTCKAGTTSCDGGVSLCDDVRPRVQACSTSDLNCDGLLSCTGQFRWAQGGLAATAAGVAAGVDGTVALAGNSTGAPGFFLSTFDARGRVCWEAPTVFNGGGTLGATGVALSGSKVTAEGRTAQVICPGGVADGGVTGGPALAASTVVVGNAAGPVDFGQGKQAGAGKTDGFVAVVDPTGKVAWGQIFGSAGDDATNAVATGASGEIYVTGALAGPLAVLPCTGTLDGGAHPSGPGAYVAALAPDGACDWIQVFTGTAAGTSISVDGTGKIIVGGTYSGTLDVEGQMLTPGTAFLARLNADGSLDGAPVNFTGCLAGAPLYVAGAPGGNVYATCTVAQSPTGTCGGTVGAPDRTYIAHYGATLGLAIDVCWGGPPPATLAVTPAGIVTDGTGVVTVLVSAGAAVTGSGITVPVGTGGVVAIKGPIGTEYIWGSAFGAPGVLQHPVIAVDGMGDLVIAGTPSTTITMPPLLLAGGGAGVFELAP
jgi:hypothetical protein